MTPENIFAITRRLDAIKEDVDEVKSLAKETNGRIRELELWRARVQGALGTTRVVWMVGGGLITGIVIGIVRGV
jgi:hypothetical protein